MHAKLLGFNYDWFIDWLIKRNLHRSMSSTFSSPTPSICYMCAFDWVFSAKSHTMRPLTVSMVAVIWRWHLDTPPRYMVFMCHSMFAMQPTGQRLLESIHTKTSRSIQSGQNVFKFSWSQCYRVCTMLTGVDFFKYFKASLVIGCSHLTFAHVVMVLQCV